MSILLIRGGIIIDTDVTRDILTDTLDSGESEGGSEDGGTGSNQYTKTVNLSAGVVTRIVTTLTTEPYSILVFDSDGNIITSGITIQSLLVSEVYVLDIYSTDALSNVKIKILY